MDKENPLEFCCAQDFCFVDNNNAPTASRGNVLQSGDIIFSVYSVLRILE